MPRAEYLIEVPDAPALQCSVAYDAGAGMGVEADTRVEVEPAAEYQAHVEEGPYEAVVRPGV